MRGSTARRYYHEADLIALSETILAVWSRRRIEGTDAAPDKEARDNFDPAAKIGPNLMAKSAEPGLIIRALAVCRIYASAGCPDQPD